MRLSNNQLKIVEELHSAGSFIWYAAGFAYLACIDKDGRVRSKPLNSKTAKVLIEAELLKQEGENKWILK